MFEEVARPVLYESEDDKFTYWGKGSSVLIGTSKHFYWVTAEHVIRNLGGDTDSLRIFPSNKSKISIPFNEKYQIVLDQSEDEEFKDIFALRIDLELFKEKGDAPLYVQDIENGAFIAENLNLGACLLVIGFPSEIQSINYDELKIKHKRSWLPARYIGQSISDHCHQLRFSDSVEIADYDGLSGSPVFYKKEAPYVNGQKAIIPLFAGLLLRGNATNKIAHFVSSNVIKNLIHKAEIA